MEEEAGSPPQAQEKKDEGQIQINTSHLNLTKLISHDVTTSHAQRYSGRSCERYLGASGMSRDFMSWDLTLGTTSRWWNPALERLLGTQ
ncbi:hypothetical protein FANTH_10868 [Fusarium anthophilum]|uniref:Uncharacterized protein n=1 Tax=Fusarium anthophilum TaxID=48485 RepID=A0A8H4Z0C3_9HYPO|nr:hypothetical protein FANTH_10868 [Fusarium anthophilum]